MILNKPDACGFCGEHAHGKRFSSHFEKQYCQAYNSKCNYCHKSLMMKVYDDSNRGTKGSNTVHQTLKCHYLIVCAGPTF